MGDYVRAVVSRLGLGIGKIVFRPKVENAVKVARFAGSVEVPTPRATDRVVKSGAQHSMMGLGSVMVV